jgi:hypothetical protein
MLTPCSACGCVWDESGYYHYKGDIEQPCIECRKDTKSVHYLNNRDRILAQQRESYYAQHEARKAYFRDYRRNQRAQASL